MANHSHDFFQLSDDPRASLRRPRDESENSGDEASVAETTAAPPASEAPPSDATAVLPEETAAKPAEDIPVAVAVVETTLTAEFIPAAESPTGEAAIALTETVVVDAVVAEAPVAEAVPVAVAVEEPPVAEPEAPKEVYCPSCGAKRVGESQFCGDCGMLFGTSAGSAPVGAPQPPPPAVKIKDRYQLGGVMSERVSASRRTGLDHGDGQKQIIIVAAPSPQASNNGKWPGLEWEKALLAKLNNPAFPKVLDTVEENGSTYLIQEMPKGRSMWDVWEEASGNAEFRYGILVKIAKAMQALHQAGAMFDGVHPDMIAINAENNPVFTDLSGLIPLPLTAGTPVRRTLHVAPEVLNNPEKATARAALYGFGAMIYALEYLHQPLDDSDFERPFQPNLITERFPDVNPNFNRVINKTFTKDINMRFPTDEMGKTDATGFTELIKTLEVCGRTLDNVHLEMAAWTTIGMIRTGNEDAFEFLHSVEARLDDAWEYALILLADGMGGYDAGEVAAALALNTLRAYLLAQPMFSSVAGKGPPPPGTFNLEKLKDILKDALKHANSTVFNASRAPGGKRGMGCTAEAVYIDNRNVVVGHVGDSRTYHMTGGILKQLTRDQTLVNRLVELGVITEDQAETHDRKNELQQAIGGQPEVVPGLYSAQLKPGDWVLVCSDGLVGHVPTRDIQVMLHEADDSAEKACRRLLNLTNLRGATDNTTVVIARCT